MNDNPLSLEEKISSSNNFISKNFANQNIKTKSSNFLISVIIPLYNEENTIKNVIERIPNHQQYEIIIVDDGSTDKSVEKIKELKDRNIKIIKHKSNLGYGATILTGLKHVDGDYIVTLDSDGQHNPEEISNLIKPLIHNKADIVVGSRFLGRCHYKMPLYARVGSYFINFFLWLFYLQKVYDNQCGFRAYKKDTLKIMKNMRHLGMGFSTEVLFKAAYNKCKIIEIPISINSRLFGTSYVNLYKITKSICLCIIYYSLRKIILNVKNTILKRIIIFLYKRVSDIKNFKF